MSQQLQIEFRRQGRWFAADLRAKDGRHLGTSYVVADDPEEARRRISEQLVDVGVEDGPMRESWRRLVEATS